MRFFPIIIVAFLVFPLTGLPAAASDTCDLAVDISEKARETFETDQQRGVQLFTKAEKLCDDPVYDYNLAMAYWRFGAHAEAIDRLASAVSEKSEPLWENNLAQMLLDTNQDPGRALSLARSAVRTAPDVPAFAATLAAAHLANNHHADALDQIHRAGRKWADNRQIAKQEKAIANACLIRYLEMIKAGQVKSGLAGLSDGAGQYPAIARAYSLGLANQGEVDQALAAARKAESRFPRDAAANGLFDQVMKQAAKNLYEAFKFGKPAVAVSRAKAFAEQWPDSTIAKTTYDELFEAYLADTASIEVPDAVADRTSAGQGNTDADNLMADLFDSRSTDQNLSLVADVDKHIPAGRTQRPWAVVVVIGNQRYVRAGKGINDVRYAERDAAIMKKYLTQAMGYNPDNIITRLNTTSGDLREIFGTAANRKGALARYVRSDTADLFVYYSGHGAPGPDGKSAYLVPVDASPDFIANNGYSLNLFYENIDRLGVKNTTVVLESCFSGDSAAGALFDNISPVMVKNVKPVPATVNAAVFCSAGKDQVATWHPDNRHGLFTYFFLKGLSGSADNDGNKTVTIGEMAGYLKKEVPYWAGRLSNRTQTPLVRGDSDREMVTLK
ncbi:MAG: caspase family protein [Thermodesulfobacteriota bacterium]|nr:caspase family protein [Thermodesulfobacteriota bacterium]